MTREEAIKILKSMSDISTQGEAIDMAIEALKAEPIRCKDCRWHKPNKRPYTCERSVPMCTQYDYCSYGERREE